MEFIDINGQYEYFKAINVYLDGDLAVQDKGSNELIKSLKESIRASISESNVLLTQMLFSMLLSRQEISNGLSKTNEKLGEILNNKIDLSPVIEAINNQRINIDLSPVIEAINNIKPIVVMVDNNKLTDDMKRWMVMHHRTTLDSLMLGDGSCNIKSPVRYLSKIERYKINK
jgi:hypothetical protein